MAKLQDLINLAKADGGKFFVMDEKGEASLVIMGIEEYQRLLLGRLQQQVMDIESINKEIIKAQLSEKDHTEIEPTVISPKIPMPKVEEFRQKVMVEQTRPVAPRVDLREEVIDPSFDFEGPKMEFDDF